MKIFTQMESDVRGYCRDYPVVFERSKGSEMFTVDGDRFIDFLGGAGALSYGHNNEHIKQAVMEYMQADGVLHGLDLHTKAKREFLTTLRSTILEPRKMDYKAQFTGPTGTNAVEAALKLARKITGRQGIISFTNGYHGMTLGAIAATGNGHHRGGAGVHLGGTTFMPFDGYFGPETNTIAYIERLLEDTSSGIDTPAAMILETVQGEGGVNPASGEWLQGIQALCRKHDILFIVDDIQVGCGRTGTFFSFENMGIDPDMIVLSKSLGGIGLPMALLLMKPEHDQWDIGEHNGTFRGNNLAFIAATTAFKRYWSDDSFTTEIGEKAAILRQHLQWIKADFPELNIEVRGRGMIWGLEIPQKGLAGEVVNEAFKRQLIIENCGTGGTVLKFLGPLTMEKAILEEGLGLLKEAVQAVYQQHFTAAGSNS
ncbi:MAG: diaminobutyrate--2-oxoglutarate transaminase [Planctomycetota bacterium]|nr:MAG: diaminobutyrate--2-oxoglutarate transaminase [Planctomycetota bacterium]